MRNITKVCCAEVCFSLEKAKNETNQECRKNIFVYISPSNINRGISALSNYLLKSERIKKMPFKRLKYVHIRSNQITTFILDNL